MAYVVVATRADGDGLPHLLGFGDHWVREYPEAQIFTRLSVAKTAAYDVGLPARDLDQTNPAFDVKVYANYGTDAEEVMAEVQR
jgi:hypothetical protein